MDNVKNTIIYKNVDLKFVKKHKKFVSDIVEMFAGKFLKLIRNTSVKQVSVDAQAKDQIMYIFFKLLGVVANKNEVPEDANDIPAWIEKSLDTTTSDYKIYKFLRGATQNLKYGFVGTSVEEKTLMIISNFVDDEDLMQHTVELFLMFIKKFSESLANLNWESTKRTNAKLVNSLLRNMNNNNTNPDIFGDIYGFSTYCKSQKLKD